VGSRELFEYSKIVIGGVVGGTVLRLLPTIPDVITVLPVRGFLDFKISMIFNEPKL